jgi:hypothetical protein
VIAVGDAVDVAVSALAGAGIAARPGPLAADAIVRGVAELAAHRWRAGERPKDPPRPLYLRAPDTGPAPRRR